jgi:hypothetical protein
MPNNYSRNTRKNEKVCRLHMCSLCGNYVMPFLGKLGDEHKGHCPKCGTVTYVSMPETVTHEFTEYFKAQSKVEVAPWDKIADIVTRDNKPAWQIEPEGSDNSVSGQWREHGYY